MGATRWLLLIHQIPPRPAALRVRVWRRLQRLGAVALKSTVYVLPAEGDAREDFEWVCREVQGAGGEATLVEASFVEGLTDAQVKGLFLRARDAEYRELGEALRRLPRAKARAAAELARLTKRFDEIVDRDYFGAPARREVKVALARAEERLAEPSPHPGAPPAESFRRRTWVTREGIYVDRMASAWLIRRFIDTSARFRFVELKHYRHRPGELRFDMFEGEFTHQAGRCTFEVLARRFCPDDRALARLGELVHDLDIKDERYRREELKGFGLSLAAIAAAHRDDDARLERACAFLDDWYTLLSSPKGGAGS